MLALWDAAIRISTLKALFFVIPKPRRLRRGIPIVSLPSGSERFRFSPRRQGQGRTTHNGKFVGIPRAKARFRMTTSSLDLIHRQLSTEVLPIRSYSAGNNRRKRLFILGILLRQCLNEGHILLERLHLISDIGQGILVNEI